MPQELHQTLKFLPTALAEEQGDRLFVALARSRDELSRWLRGAPLGLQWIQIEGLISDPYAWAQAASGTSRIPLDVVLSDPASEFSDLYRLVDVYAKHDIRVTMPAAPGFLKAIKLAASLRLPVRVLPGQPTPEVLAELMEALDFYLHEPMVETPVEFFHSLLASKCCGEEGSLWMILEEDPSAYLHYDEDGRPKLPRLSGFRPFEISPEDFVEQHLKSLIDQNAECATCPWQRVCRGYFKWPDPPYTCEGVKQLFLKIESAAGEIERDLASIQEQPHLSGKDKP